MHELSLCRSLCEQLLTLCRQEGVSRLHKVELEIGVLSCVEPEALRFCFENMAKPEPLLGAQLAVLRTDARAECADCGYAYAMTGWQTLCPRCGSVRRTVSGGEAVIIKSVEVS